VTGSVSQQTPKSELVKLTPADLLELRGAVGIRRVSMIVGTVREPRRFTTSRCVGLCTVAQETGASAALHDRDASLVVNLVRTRRPEAGSAPMKKSTVQLPFATSGCACPRRWWVFWWMSRHLVTFLVPCSSGAVLVWVGREEIINVRCGRRSAPRSKGRACS